MASIDARAAHPARSFRYYDLVLAGFVAILLCSNLIGPGKACELTLPFALPFIGATLVFGAGNIFFPISYIFDDVHRGVRLRCARRVIWRFTMLFATLMSVVRLVAADADGAVQRDALPALQVVRQYPADRARVDPRLLVGDFVNAYVLAKMKIWIERPLALDADDRLTIFGEGVDSLLFYPLAFYGTGIIPDDKLPMVMLAQFVTKVAVEVLFTPVTYYLVARLKKAEDVDYYDRDTNFTPFSLQD